MFVICFLFVFVFRSVTLCAEPNDSERILRERRPTTSNNEELLNLMEATRMGRREWIDCDHPTITEILKRYPRFQDMNAAVSSDKILSPEV